MFTQNRPLLLLTLFIFPFSLKTAPTALNNKYLTAKNMILGALSSAITAKVAHTFYYHYLWPNESMMSYYRETYTKIDKILYSTDMIYTHHASLSDDELKSFIQDSPEFYPFVAYHDELQETIDTLEYYTSLIKDGLKRINTRKERLKTHETAEEMALLHTYTQLEEHGRLLIVYSNKISLTLSTLKDRITSLTEYQDDHYFWQHDQENKEITTLETQEESSPSITQKPVDKKEPEVATPDAFDRIENAIIEFNLDYY